ncbi:3069_t:CDS:2 [Ambispora gerdemannii]|uniref:3069_t:CDS:1 n=1 Tax=Ambispora gerdemannii TaxID=144530 RepID=A0A9N9DFH2_9GLOM|nr:3069_t:CDS:2 [Ambispora gerdemannii]
MGVEKIEFDFDTNQVVIKCKNNQKLNITDSGLPPKQQEELTQQLKSTHKPITFSQVDKEVNRNEKPKNDNSGIIGAAILIMGIIAIVIGVYKRLWTVLYPNPLVAPRVADSKVSIEIINDKIKLLKKTNKQAIDIGAYQRYFDFLEKLGLQEEFDLATSQDKLIIHGTTLFYTMHLALQRGYQVVAYDARNHGLSEKSYTSLGQLEACDLQDIIEYGYFAGPSNLEVAFTICEAPFDHFAKQ